MFGQNPLKDVDPRVFTRIVTDGRMDGSVTISPRNFVGEGIKSVYYNLYIYFLISYKILIEHSRINILQWILTKHGTYLVLTRVWIPIDFQGQRSMSLGQIFTT
jgi:hypothetical protein